MTVSQVRLHSSDGQSEFLSKYCPNVHRIFTTHPCLNGFIFITVMTSDLAELLNDWLLFIDLSAIEPGLVYGPLDPVTILLLLMICVAGTLLFSFEIINLLRDMITGKPWLDHDLISALIIWFIQIPMVIINIIVSLCHDEPVTYYQLTKAILIGIAIILRAVNPLLRTYVNKYKYSGNERFRNYIYRIITTIGICLLMVGCVMMFIFSHLIGADEKRFKLRLPQETWTGDSVQEKYFTDVGIYIQINSSGDFNHSGQQYSIKLTDILECYTSNPLYVKLSILQINNTIQEIVLNKFDTHYMYSIMCYTLKSQGNVFKPTNTNCTPVTDLRNFSMKIMFKFVLIPARWQLILGDIIYNAVVLADEKCQRIWDNSTGIYIGNNPDSITHVGKILYQKFEVEDRVIVNSILKSRVIFDMTEDGIRTGQYLIDAKKYWKTGLLGCQCNGKMGPSLDPSSVVPC